MNSEISAPLHGATPAQDAAALLATPTTITLTHGDCVPLMRTLPSESVDVVVTSPPYNLDIKYGTYRDNTPRDAYLLWTREWCGEVKRLLKPNGSFFLNIGASPSNPWLPHEVALSLRELFVLQNPFHWIKSITIKPRSGDEISAGHFKPINSKRYVTDCHEHLFHFTHDGNVPLDRLAVGVAYADKSNISRWGHTGGSDKRCRGNNWFIPYKTIKSRTNQRPHPATFPIELAEQCIKLHGRNAELTVLDPFVGIGSAAVAAQRCGVSRFIGFEVDEEYVAEAAVRTSLAGVP